MIEGYTPLRALLEAVVDAVHDELSIGPAEIGVRVDSKPPASCGDLYIAVYGSGSSSQVNPDFALDQDFSVSLAVTQRTGFIPDDRMGLDGALNLKTGCLTIMQGIYRAMTLRKWQINNQAAMALDATAWDGCFVEPLQLAGGYGTIVSVGPSHFSACMPRTDREIVARDYGLLGTMSYSGGRYMENVIVETVGRSTAPVF